MIKLRFTNRARRNINNGIHTYVSPYILKNDIVAEDLDDWYNKWAKYHGYRTDTIIRFNIEMALSRDEVETYEI